MDGRAAVGRYGEDVAAHHLQALGLRILTRNWRCRAGEVDIIAVDGDTLVFCEVKTRRTTAFGSPQAAVTRQKLARLRRLAATWLAQQDESWTAIRIDVVAVTPAPGGPPTVEHLPAVG